MTAETFDLNFGGYWREPNIGGIPARSGVYGVYAAMHNLASDTVSLHRLIYIGESANVHDRVAGHEKWPQWRSQLQQGEVICFTMAPISPTADRQRAEAAMIYEHKPVCNDEYKDSFPFEQTTITTNGCNALMTPLFTVYSTIQSSYYGTGRQR